jgi:hypothetical protein
MMDVIVKIAGREALPVWTIPYITSWDISADMLLKRLVAPNYNNESAFPDAFNLDSYGDPHSIPSMWWFDTETRISMLEDELTDKKIPQYKKLDKWHKRSVEIIMQSTGCYIWLDEFKKWLECYNNYDNKILVKPTDNGRGFTPYHIELFLNPPLPPEHALYFKNTEIMELKAKAPLDKIDKGLLDARTIALRSPTLSLQNFIDRVLADAIGTKATLPTFYDLVEEHGLIVYDKVIDGQIVPSGELLDSLRQREQQANQSFDDDSFQFWEALAKESKYSVLFDDVAMAYDRAGKSVLPWLNMDNIVLLLNVQTAIAKVVMDEGQNPWLIIDSNDPPPEQPWYTPARYFARQHVINDSNLLTNKNMLETKVVLSLNNAGIKTSRKGKFSRNGTIKKAWVNVDLG